MGPLKSTESSRSLRWKETQTCETRLGTHSLNLFPKNLGTLNVSPLHPMACAPWLALQPTDQTSPVPHSSLRLNSSLASTTIGATGGGFPHRREELFRPTAAETARRFSRTSRHKKVGPAIVSHV